ncbi:nose resistant to fluoxetine protein 6 [Drosophila grimshawi]|uniref:nose resistant to fluoxetine protein 6 n=1 Tax=Drosophila grimshawi TaxID=7222 RepID=UPI0013EF1638|nr:nose resistant to fluoxetine protein 6 [Drosophila grimshawi]
MMLQSLILLFVIGVLAKQSTGLESDSLLWRLTNLVQLQQNGTRQTTPCVKQLQILHYAWHEQQGWALKVFDASGSGYDNFMLGNSLWLGNPQTCRAVNEQLLRAVTQRQQQLLQQYAPFAFDYRLAYLRANSPWQLALSVKETPLLHIGLCVPRACDPNQLERLLHETLSTAGAGGHADRLQMRVELVYTKQPKLSAKFFASNAFRMLAALVAVILLLMLLAHNGWDAASPVIGCFNVASNWQRLWQLSADPQQIGVINGLRVCSAFGLLCLHVVWYLFYSVNHSSDLTSKMVKINLVPYFLPALLEVFFVVSGFLTVTNFLRNESLQCCIAEDTLSGNVRRCGRQLAHRYLRLAPLQFVMILMSVVSFAYHREASVFHLTNAADELCTRHWWRNLLFVQNLYPVKEMCCNWTWYLGCEMQLHIGAMVLLYLHTRYAHSVRRLVIMLLLGNIAYSALLPIILDVPLIFDLMYEKADWLYTKPTVRMSSYIIGSIYGYAHASGTGSPFEAVFPNKLAKSGLAVVALWLGITLLRSAGGASPLVLGCTVQCNSHG